ncbi:SRPBCC family protein [Microlunatus parietis]
MHDHDGSLDHDHDGPVINFVRRLPYPIERVWAALTDPEQRRHWFGPTMIDGRVGGRIDLVPTGPAAPVPDKRMTGRILVWDPPRVLEHEWRQAPIEDGIVRYELEADGDETVLRFTHRGLTEVNARGFLPGTHAYFDRLAAHLSGAAMPNWIRRYDELAPRYVTLAPDSGGR